MAYLLPIEKHQLITMTLAKGNSAFQQAGLLNRIYRGDKDAEKILVGKFYKPLLFILKNQTNDHQLSSDLCQDTFILVINKARNGEISNEKSLPSFIRSIGINLLIDYKRKGLRQRTDTLDTFENINDESSKNIEVSFERQRLVEIVSQVINEMKTERDRQILQLTYGSNMDKKDICDELSLTSEHYDRVLSRSKLRLKQLLIMKLNISEQQFSLIDILTLIAFIAFISNECFSHVRGLESPHHILGMKTEQSCQHSELS